MNTAIVEVFCLDYDSEQGNDQCAQDADRPPSSLFVSAHGIESLNCLCKDRRSFTKREHFNPLDRCLFCLDLNEQNLIEGRIVVHIDYIQVDICSLQLRLSMITNF